MIYGFVFIFLTIKKLTCQLRKAGDRNITNMKITMIDKLHFLIFRNSGLVCCQYTYLSFLYFYIFYAFTNLYIHIFLYVL